MKAPSRRPAAERLALRRELLVATSTLQRLQLRHELHHGPWAPAALRLRTVWHVARLVRRWLRGR